MLIHVLKLFAIISGAAGTASTPSGLLEIFSPSILLFIGRDWTILMFDREAHSSKGVYPCWRRGRRSSNMLPGGSLLDGRTILLWYMNRQVLGGASSAITHRLVLKFLSTPRRSHMPPRTPIGLH